MPRYNDEWVVDRTMYEFVSGGSCACCGLQHMFAPDGVVGLINSISDLETDAANNEISALDKCPWPATMRDQVWADRVRLRYKLKKEMSTYKKFWSDHGEDMSRWILNSNDIQPKKVARLLQMPRMEVTERLGSKYNIHSAFGIVLCAVTEQVAHFPLTKYKTDGRGENSGEVEFENILTYDKRCGFTLSNIINKDDGTLNIDTVTAWLKRMKTLGGPKLLERAPKKTGNNNKEEKYDDENNSDDEEDGGEGDADEHENDPEDNKPGPSFRSDRRIVRLLVARYWADQLIKKYMTYVEKTETAKEEALEKATDSTTTIKTTVDVRKDNIDDDDEKKDDNTTDKSDTATEVVTNAINRASIVD